MQGTTVAQGSRDEGLNYSEQWKRTYRDPAGVGTARTLPQIGRGVLEAGSKPWELSETVSSMRQGLSCCSSPSDD